MSAPEYFTALSDDWWVCVCGNDPQGAGHAPATVEGIPTSDATWSAHRTLVCLDCGRYAAPKYVVEVQGRADISAVRAAAQAEGMA